MCPSDYSDNDTIPTEQRPGPGPALRLNKVSAEITHHGAARAWADSGNYAANEENYSFDWASSYAVQDTGPGPDMC